MNFNDKISRNDWWERKRPEVKKNVFDELKQNSPMKTTDIMKIVINSGVGKFSTADKKFLDNTFNALKNVAFGQKPVFTYSKKSIVNFKIRSGMPLGCKVTLRKKRAWDFLFELINIALPATPNFRGVSRNKFDLLGNYNLGISSLNIFPTIPYEYIFRNQGMQITLVFSSNDIEENQTFLKFLGFPFEVKR